MSENLKEEENHIHKVLQSNDYDNATIRAGSKDLPSKYHTNIEQEKSLILTIPYIAGLSESIQRVCRDFGIKTAFKSGKTLRSHLTKVKDLQYSMECQHPGSSKPMSLLNLLLSGVICSYV